MSCCCLRVLPSPEQMDEYPHNAQVMRSLSRIDFRSGCLCAKAREILV
jgi:hypothetical protein